MEVLLFIALFIVGGLLSFIIKAKFKFVYYASLSFIFLALLISISSWLFYCSVIRNVSLLSAVPVQLKWGDGLGYLLLGYMMMYLFIALTSAETNEQHTKKITGLTLSGITILTGFSFITECFWKTENMCKMTRFFTLSGYSLWFLYFIVVAEGLGGLGVLLHFKLKTGPVAAAGLMLIMIGALYTHCHNKDPFSESYPAIEQFMMLGLMQVIYYFEQLGQPRPMSFTLTDQ